MLDSVSGWAQDALASAGLPALGALVLLENVFPPIPSEVILPLAGFLAAQGRFALPAAIAVATLGSVAGALVLYALGRFGGRPLAERYGRLLRIGPRDLDRAEGWFARRGAAVVLFGRLVPGVRSLVSLPAGWARMPLARFTVLTAIGSAAWNTALIVGGWALGANYERLGAATGSASRVVTIALLVLAAPAAATWWRRRLAADAGQLGVPPRGHACDLPAIPLEVDG